MAEANKTDDIKFMEKNGNSDIGVYVSEFNGREYLHVREHYIEARTSERKPTKKGAGSKAKPAKGKEGGVKGNEDTHRCANCDAPGAKMKCGRCGVERYCDRDCQKVRWG